MINRIKCWMLGHFYRPMHLSQIWSDGGERVQYTCYCCGVKTPWMRPQRLKRFEQKYRPTWGNRGSNSQGY